MKRAARWTKTINISWISTVKIKPWNFSQHGAFKHSISAPASRLYARREWFSSHSRKKIHKIFNNSLFKLHLSRFLVQSFFFVAFINNSLFYHNRKTFVNHLWHFFGPRDLVQGSHFEVRREVGAGGTELPSTRWPLSKWPPWKRSMPTWFPSSSFSLIHLLRWTPN